MGVFHLRTNADRDDYPYWQQWWSQKGGKMSPRAGAAGSDELIIENGRIARLTIAKIPKTSDHRRWKLSWYILHEYRGGDGLDDVSEGRILMSEIHFRAAFMVSGVVCSDYLRKRFGANAGEQGLFIRQGPYLNIPGPGTGNDGDPNISILVSHEIRAAVEKFIQTARSL